MLLKTSFHFLVLFIFLSSKFYKDKTANIWIQNVKINALWLQILQDISVEVYILIAVELSYIYKMWPSTIKTWLSTVSCRL